MEYPLDLSDEELFYDGPELSKALADLDENGWNTSGTLHRTTWLRVLFQHCRIREDILEIALGSGEEDITLQAERVRRQIQAVNSSMPDFMQAPPEDILSSPNTHLGAAFLPGKTKEGMRQLHAVFVLCIHTGMVHTDFLLQRALVSRLKTDTKQLIPIARRMMKLVLLAQSRRDFFHDFQGDLIYLLAFHGLPAAGVLAVELLKESQMRQFAPDLIPRSATIQDLSVFISALAAVGPGEGNFSICNQGRRALTRVLDQILSPNPPPLPATSGSEQPTSAADTAALQFPIGNDADFLQWLESAEWDKDWIVPLAATAAPPSEAPA
jgi:hypothetical protein